MSSTCICMCHICVLLIPPDGLQVASTVGTGQASQHFLFYPQKNTAVVRAEPTEPGGMTVGAGPPAPPSRPVRPKQTGATSAQCSFSSDAGDVVQHWSRTRKASGLWFLSDQGAAFAMTPPLRTLCSCPHVAFKRCQQGFIL